MFGEQCAEAIPLEELGIKGGGDDDDHDAAAIPRSPPATASSSSSSEDIVQFEKSGGNRPTATATSSFNNLNIIEHHHHPSSATTRITLPDALFSAAVCVLCACNFVLELLVISEHYRRGDKWAATVTVIFFMMGGVAVLYSVWRIPVPALERIYDSGKCVRITINAVPWVATIITYWQTTRLAFSSLRNPMLVQRQISLDNWARALLRFQTIAQCAPQAVVQVVVILEGFRGMELSSVSLLVTCVLVSLTMTMCGNLPGRGDVVEGRLPRASYSPVSRVFVGARMTSSFCSRTMSLSIFFASFRWCVLVKSTTTSTTVTSHLIPFAVLLVPRLLFGVVEYGVAWRRKRRTTTTIPSFTPSNEVYHDDDDDNGIGSTTTTTTTVKLPISSPTTTTFPSTLFPYLATVFFAVGDPVWLFWYVSIETVLFMVSGCVGYLLACDPTEEGSSNQGYLDHHLVYSADDDWVVVTAYLSLFLVLFVGVPCLVPWVVLGVRGRDGGRDGGRRTTGMRSRIT